MARTFEAKVCLRHFMEPYGALLWCFRGEYTFSSLSVRTTSNVLTSLICCGLKNGPAKYTRLMPIPHCVYTALFSGSIRNASGLRNAVSCRSMSLRSRFQRLHTCPVGRTAWLSQSWISQGPRTGCTRLCYGQELSLTWQSE